jgi:Sulfotransferase family
MDAAGPVDAVHDLKITSSLRQSLNRLRFRAATTVFSAAGRIALFDPPESWHPIFLLGCGRSGTTITGTLLAEHPDVLYLNEPRHIWRASDPRTDIWHPNVRSRAAKLALDERDVDPTLARRCRRAFYVRQLVSRRANLIEKLPINNFRIGYLRRSFPNARYVHIVRHGLEVAYSMARLPNWFNGNEDFRWDSLVTMAQASGIDSRFLAACHHPIERGLIEWTLSVETALKDLSDLDQNYVFTMRYEDLISDPLASLQQLHSHLRLSPDPDSVARAGTRVMRVNPDASELKLPASVHERTTQLLTRLGYKV